MDMNKLLKFYWKKGEANIDLATEVILLIAFWWSFFFFVSFSHFLLFVDEEEWSNSSFYCCLKNGYKQIVEILLEKGEANVNLCNWEVLYCWSKIFWKSKESFFFFFLPNKWSLFSLSSIFECKEGWINFIYFFIHFFIVWLFFSPFSFFDFFYLQDGATPLCIAVEKGHEQIVQILLEKREPNVDLADQVILLIVSCQVGLFFFFTFYIFLFFDIQCKGMEFTPLYIAAQGGHEQVVEILLEKGENQMLILPDQVIFFVSVSFSFSFWFHFFIFIFSFSIFFIFYFFCQKNGTTPLYIAAQGWIWASCWIFVRKRRSKYWSCWTSFLSFFVLIILICWKWKMDWTHISKTKQNNSYLFFILSPPPNPPPFFLFSRNMEQLHLILLLLMDIIKLFNFYWNKGNRMLILEERFFFFFFFPFSFFFLKTIFFEMKESFLFLWLKKKDQSNI